MSDADLDPEADADADSDAAAIADSDAAANANPDVAANADPGTFADTGIPFERKWFRFGLALAFLYATFTLVLVWLLAIDQTLALVVAAVGGTVGAIALWIFVRYVY